MPPQLKSSYLKPSRQVELHLEGELGNFTRDALNLKASCLKFMPEVPAGTSSTETIRLKLFFNNYIYIYITFKNARTTSNE